MDSTAQVDGLLSLIDYFKNLYTFAVNENAELSTQETILIAITEFQAELAVIENKMLNAALQDARFRKTGETSIL